MYQIYTRHHTSNGKKSKPNIVVPNEKIVMQIESENEGKKEEEQIHEE